MHQKKLEEYEHRLQNPTRDERKSRDRWLIKKMEKLVKPIFHLINNRALKLMLCGLRPKRGRALELNRILVEIKLNENWLLPHLKDSYRFYIRDN